MLAVVCVGLAVFALLGGAIAVGHIRMALWKRRHQRISDRLAGRSSTTLAEHYAGRRPMW